MKFNILRITAILAGLAVIGTASAKSASDFYADMDEPHGTVVGWSKRPASDIYETRIIKINGEEMPSERGVVYLQPGEYTLEFQILTRNHQPSARTRLTRREPKDYNELKLTVEAGKRYYIGGKFNRRTSDFPWSIVLWKVEPDEEEETSEPE